jgi:hypothetical protein
MLSEYARSENEAPPERERSLCASARELEAVMMLRLQHAILSTTQEHRAPTPLHVGRCHRDSVLSIQGRRVGEWHRQHRLHCRRVITRDQRAGERPGVASTSDDLGGGRSADRAVRAPRNGRRQAARVIRRVGLAGHGTGAPARRPVDPGSSRREDTTL